MSPYHSFLEDFAVAFGLDPAIILSYICEKVEEKRICKRDEIDGHHWVNYTQKNFEAIFGYMKPSKIRSSIIKLKEAGALLEEKHGQELDRSCWYSVSDEILNAYTSNPSGRGV